jgi:hypothetical protein
VATIKATATGAAKTVKNWQMVSRLSFDLASMRSFGDSQGHYRTLDWTLPHSSGFLI